MSGNLYFFVSTRRADNLTQITIFASSVDRAYALANRHFKANKYVGRPKMLAV